MSRAALTFQFRSNFSVISAKNTPLAGNQRVLKHLNPTHPRSPRMKEEPPLTLNWGDTGKEATGSPGQPLSALCLPLAVPVGHLGQLNTRPKHPFPAKPQLRAPALPPLLAMGEAQHWVGAARSWGEWAAQCLEVGKHQNMETEIIFKKKEKRNESTQRAPGSSTGRTQRPLPLYSWAEK